MPTINICSDLHLEFGELTMPGGDILILSGDVCEAVSLTKPDGKFINSLASGGDVYRNFFQQVSQKYRHIVYVMGNHEHYHGTFFKTADLLRQHLPTNVTLLEKQSIVIDGYLFIGGTLWTDMNRKDPVTLFTMKDMMNDYHTIKMKEQGYYRKLRPEDTVKEHEAMVTFITSELNRNSQLPNPLPVVVVTHHAPSKASVKPRYVDDHIVNGAYSSDLSNIILDHPEIKLWTHGHTHDFFHYNIGTTQIVCNPRGYYGYEERSELFDPGFAITL